jgi:hypothetical protein
VTQGSAVQETGSAQTRATVVWFVVAAAVGLVSALLHLLRSEVWGSHDALPLTVLAFATTAFAALLVYRGVLVAAEEQDAVRRRPSGGAARRPVR